MIGKKIKNSYGKQAINIAIILSIVILVLGQKEVSRGIILGSFFSVINFGLVKKSLEIRITKINQNITRVKAILLAFFSVLFRYLGMAIPLLVAIKFDKVSIIGVVIGLFTIQLVILFNIIPNTNLLSFFTKKKIV